MSRSWEIADRHARPFSAGPAQARCIADDESDGGDEGAMIRCVADGIGLQGDEQVARMSASDMRVLSPRGPGYRCAHLGYAGCTKLARRLSTTYARTVTPKPV